MRERHSMTAIAKKTLQSKYVAYKKHLNEQIGCSYNCMQPSSLECIFCRVYENPDVLNIRFG